MTHIHLPDGLPGIVGPLAYSPDTVKPMLSPYGEQGLQQLKR
jgi:hypothetical protein